MFKSLARIVALIAIISIPLAYQTKLAIDSHVAVQDMNRAIFAMMDMHIRIFHHTGGHESPVQGCRECQRELYDYFEGLHRKYPDVFLER